jgi:hypothetical protein
MRRVFSLTILWGVLLASASAQFGMYQHGSVVRMHMGDCMLSHHGFVTTFGGPEIATPQESCPEYTLVSSRVVYIIVGKSSNQMIPLAETIDFCIRKNELAVRVDDAKHDFKFTIKEMVMRSDWDRIQRHMDEQMRIAEDPRAMKARD